MCRYNYKSASYTTLITFIIIFFCSFKFDQSPYERLKSGEISTCAFYNQDSNSVLKFKTGIVNYARWSGIPLDDGQYKLEEYNLSYSFSKHGMSGNINGVPFIILSKTTSGSQVFYLKYNGLNYVLNDHYSN